MTGPQGMGVLQPLGIPIPIAQYKLEETSGTNVDDNIGIYADGTSTNVGLAASGAFSRAFMFNGSNAYFLGQVYGSLGSNVLNSSWEVWIKTSTRTGSYIFGTTNNNNSGNPYIRMIINGDTTAGSEFSSNSQRLALSIRLIDARIRKWYSAAIPGLFDNEWHHIVWVISSISTATLYVDGVSTGLTLVTSGTGSSGPADFEYPVAFGAHNLRGAPDGYTDCRLDHIAIYNYQLTAGDVAGLYAAHPADGAFSVLTIPDLYAWYDASDVGSITINGSNEVSQWNDKSGNGFHLVQATTAAKPHSSTRTVNGLNVVDFDTGDVLEFTPLTKDYWLNNYTICFFGGQDTNRDNDGFVVMHADSLSHSPPPGNDYDQVNSMVLASSDASNRLGNNNGGAGALASGTGATPIATWLGYADSGASAQLGIINPSGTTTTAVRAALTGRTAVASGSGILIAGRWLGGSTAAANRLDGPMGEIIIVRGKLSTARITALRSYMVTKWGA
jgi:hypothetical protein